MRSRHGSGPGRTHSFTPGSVMACTPHSHPGSNAAPPPPGPGLGGEGGRLALARWVLPARGSGWRGRDRSSGWRGAAAGRLGVCTRGGRVWRGVRSGATLRSAALGSLPPPPGVCPTPRAQPGPCPPALCAPWFPAGSSPRPRVSPCHGRAVGHGQGHIGSPTSPTRRRQQDPAWLPGPSAEPQAGPSPASSLHSGPLSGRSRGASAPPAALLRQQEPRRDGSSVSLGQQPAWRGGGPGARGRGPGALGGVPSQPSPAPCPSPFTLLQASTPRTP